MRRASIHRQQGMVLITSLVMLVLLTLFVLSAIRIANINLQIVGNYQWQRAMEAVTDSAIAQVNSDANNFTNTTGWDICADGSITAPSGCTVLLNPKIGNVTAPHCLFGAPAQGQGEGQDDKTRDNNVWVVAANASDPSSGAQLRITSSVLMPQLVGNCTP